MGILCYSAAFVTGRSDRIRAVGGKLVFADLWAYCPRLFHGILTELRIEEEIVRVDLTLMQGVKYSICQIRYHMVDELERSAVDLPRTFRGKYFPSPSYCPA